MTSYKNGTNPEVSFPLLLDGNSTQTAYGVSYDHSIIIDRDGIIQYSKSGANITAINNKINELTATTIDEDNSLIRQFRLEANFPNPFNPRTTIRFSLEKQQQISLNVFDINGRLIAVLLNKSFNSGSYTTYWNGLNSNGIQVPTGYYFYQLRGSDKILTRKMLLMR